MQKGQVALGVGAIILVLLLFFVGKTVSHKETAKDAHEVSVSISFDEYEKQLKANLSPVEKAEMDALLAQLQAASSSSDTALLKKLYGEIATFWSNLGHSAISANYLYQSAKIEQNKSAFENAGDAFVNAYKSGTDSIVSNNLITFALRSFEDALQLDGSDIDLKIKLADVYVQGSQEPMKGIEMLRKLSDSLPENIPVLLALGRLSIQSGQFDKAKERLQKILQFEPQNTEALYFMAITEAELGHNDEAIRLFEMCKLLIGNKEFDKEIDEIVKNLKK